MSKNNIINKQVYDCCTIIVLQYKLIIIGVWLVTIELYDKIFYTIPFDSCSMNKVCIGAWKRGGSFIKYPKVNKTNYIYVS